MKKLFLLILLFGTYGCATGTMGETPKPSKSMGEMKQSLGAALAAQPDKSKARYKYRNPSETLSFLGIEPGMTVVEALPGGGWYTKILLPYLGSNGALVGADYAQHMYPLFGFFSAEAIEKKKTWTTDWTKEANGWRGDDSASVQAFQFGSMPSSMKGEADAVLFIRAIHNLHRFETEGEFFTQAMDDAWNVLKPGGIVGVVQHRAPESHSDESTQGGRGYLKASSLIAKMEARGFKLVGQSEINANPKDMPSEEDIVWRLPPSMVTSREDPELRAKMEMVGESDRMTLKFRKP